MTFCYARIQARSTGACGTSRPLGCERVLISVRVYVFAAFYEASGASARNRREQSPGRHQSPPDIRLLYGRNREKARGKFGCFGVQVFGYLSFRWKFVQIISEASNTEHLNTRTPGSVEAVSAIAQQDVGADGPADAGEEIYGVVGDEGQAAQQGCASAIRSEGALGRFARRLVTVLRL